MKARIPLVLTPQPEGGYTVTSPLLPELITEGDTVTESDTNAQTLVGEPSCKPLLKWPGGKRSELGWIRPRIPPHTRYFEPFFGGGSVFFDSINVGAHVNDRHPDLMSFYSCVQGQRAEFFDQLKHYVCEWEEGNLDDRAAMYYRARRQYNASTGSTSQRAANFFLLRQFAYGGMFRVNSDGDFNVPFGKAYARSDNLLRKKVEFLQSATVREKMRLLSLSTLDFEDFLASFTLTGDDFVFLDPPYDSTFSKYHRDFTGSDQERLARCLENLRGKFMLVIKQTPLIEQLYFTNGYSIHMYDFGYKFNIKGRFSRSATHAIITNYGTDL